ncbi:SFRP4 protein, partial [Grus americana]|nr:SFRP4 protein [Grus americana]
RMLRALVAVSLWLRVSPRAQGAPCEAVRIPMCRSMPWNITRMPNHLHHSTQENARCRCKKTKPTLSTYLAKNYSYSKCMGENASLCPSRPPLCPPRVRQLPVGAAPTPGHVQQMWCEDSAPPQLFQVGFGPRTPNFPLPKPTACTQPVWAVVISIFLIAVIHAKVKSIERGNCNEITTMVEVKDILKSSTPIPLSQVPLLTNSSCQCPPLQPKQDVLIMCYEWRSRLMLLDGCLVEKWKDQLNKRFKRWEQRLQEQKLRTARSKNQNAGRSGRSGAPNPSTKNTNLMVSGPKKATKIRNGQKEINPKKV